VLQLHDGAVPPSTWAADSPWICLPAGKQQPPGDTDLTTTTRWTLHGRPDRHRLGNGNLWARITKQLRLLRLPPAGLVADSDLHAAADALYTATNIIECSTCHNVHMQASRRSTFARNFLRETQTDNTSLCRACHLSKR